MTDIIITKDNDTSYNMNGYILVPTCEFRWLESINIFLGTSQLILQQKWFKDYNDNSKRDYEWKNIPIINE